MVKDMTRNLKTIGRMAANKSWWVSDLLAAECDKAWLHAGFDDTMQNGTTGWER